MQHRIALPLAAAASIALASCTGGGAVTPAALAAPAVRHASAAPTGVVIPMYMNPGKLWNQVIAQKQAHPSVPILLIANVDNGPGRSKQAAYASYIAKEQTAGISVIGYVPTGYAKRAASVIEAQMLQWSTFYKANGIFLDEMNPSPSQRSYYTALTAYAQAHSLAFVMGNAGEPTPGNAGPDALNIWEEQGYPSVSFLKKNASAAYPKTHWSFMAGDVPFDAATITADAPYVGYIYATDGREPECYCTLPTYFDHLVNLLSTLD